MASRKKATDRVSRRLLRGNSARVNSSSSNVELVAQQAEQIKTLQQEVKRLKERLELLRKAKAAGTRVIKETTKFDRRPTKLPDIKPVANDDAKLLARIKELQYKLTAEEDERLRDRDGHEQEVSALKKQHTDMVMEIDGKYSSALEKIDRLESVIQAMGREGSDREQQLHSELAEVKRQLEEKSKDAGNSDAALDALRLKLFTELEMLKKKADTLQEDYNKRVRQLRIKWNERELQFRTLWDHRETEWLANFEKWKSSARVLVTRVSVTDGKQGADHDEQQSSNPLSNDIICELNGMVDMTHKDATITSTYNP